MHKSIHDYSRKHGDYNSCQHTGIVYAELRLEVLDSQLDCPCLLRDRQDHGICELVPAVDEHQCSGCDKTGLGQREDDLCETLKERTSVYCGTLLQLLGNRGHETMHQEDGSGQIYSGICQDQGTEGVIQMQEVVDLHDRDHQCDDGDQDSRKQECEDQVVPSELLPGQSECGHGRNNKVQCSSDNGHYDRMQEHPRQIADRERIPVVRELPDLRQCERALDVEFKIGLERRDKDPDKRKDHEQQEENQEEPLEELRKDIDRSEFFCCIHSDASLLFPAQD